jgi:hypothetical protein
MAGTLLCFRFVLLTAPAAVLADFVRMVFPGHSAIVRLSSAVWDGSMILRVTFCYEIRCGDWHFTNERIHAGDDLPNFPEKRLSFPKSWDSLRRPDAVSNSACNTVNRSAFISLKYGMLYKVLCV